MNGMSGVLPYIFEDTVKVAREVTEQWTMPTILGLEPFSQHDRGDVNLLLMARAFSNVQS